jgi:hypothetical protein
MNDQRRVHSHPAQNYLYDAAAVLAEERRAIWGNADRPDFSAGIALSGGGIRAAIVALGVLQTLAERDLLRRFHYLSTVSGGGYIGCALSWFWSRTRRQEEKLLDDQKCQFGSSPGDFPFQDRPTFSEQDLNTRPGYHALDIAQKAQRNLEFLRNHGSYLTTGDGIAVAGMLIAVARTVLASLMVWVPLLLMIFGLLEFVDQRICDAIGESCALAVLHRPLYTVLLLAAGIIAIGFVLSVILLGFINPTYRQENPRLIVNRVTHVVLTMIVAPCLVAAIILWVPGYSNIQPMSGAAILLTLLLSAYLIALSAKLFGPNPSYYLRRKFEKLSTHWLPIVLLLLAAGSLPLIGEYAKPSNSAFWPLLFQYVPSSIAGTISLLSGVAVALYGYYLRAKSINPGLAGRAFATGGAFLFIFGLITITFETAHELIVTPGVSIYVLIFVISSFVISLCLGFLSSVNGTGLHRFYRDRLMETFMPMVRGIDVGQAMRSDIADTLSITSLWNGDEDRGRRPFHIINTCAILIKDKEAKVAMRGGDNFTVSANFIGSKSTGWMKATDYIERSGPVTVATAMAASGAAANAHSGYIGSGPTRDSIISAVMSILNIRLGVWTVNPATIKRTRRKARGVVATYFRPALFSGIFGAGYTRESRFLELSDGGHFENLGLYELARREVKLAVVVDAEQDQAISLSSLVSSANRIREDFGAIIRFEEGRGPEMLIGQESKQYPSGVRIAASPFIVGEISYADGTTGVIIYIKSTMMTGLEFATDGYSASNPEFPHQSTIDQFFDPDQFEAYRDLGRKSCAAAIDKLDLQNDFENPQTIVSRFVFKKKVSLSRHGVSLRRLRCSRPIAG